MTSKISVDFGKTAKDYAAHRAGFPDSFFERLRGCESLSQVKQILDLGTGTGTLARGFAAWGHKVVGLDPSEALLAEAKSLSISANLDVHYVVGAAEATTLPSASFDIVSAGQCWHWFKPKEAISEIERVLRPGGLLLVAYFDWLTQPNNPVDAMTKLRKKYNPNWKSEWPLGFYPWQPGDLSFPNWKSVFYFNYEELVPYTHEGWRGRMRSYAGIGGSLPPTKVEEFDREFASVLKEKFPEEPMQIPHKVWCEIWQR